MPGPLFHVTSTMPFVLGYKWLNILTLFLAAIFPDLMPVIISPVLIFVFDLKGARLNCFFTFFDQSILGGIITAGVLSAAVLLLIRFCPRLSMPFKWKQNYSAKAIVISGILGVALHIALDKFA